MTGWTRWAVRGVLVAGLVTGLTGGCQTEGTRAAEDETPAALTPTAPPPEEDTLHAPGTSATGGAGLTGITASPATGGAGLDAGMAGPMGAGARDAGSTARDAGTPKRQ
jgi:hypothetical protein